jgi:hypothetical protein
MAAQAAGEGLAAQAERPAAHRLAGFQPTPALGDAAHLGGRGAAGQAGQPAADGVGGQRIDGIDGGHGGGSDAG